MDRTVYQRVVLLGIDGMGRFSTQTSTPCMDAIFGEGAVTDEALSMNPTISAENWGAMLLGATPLVHGLTNEIISHRVYTNPDLPSVFRRIRKVMPDAVLASCCTWNPINHGIIEQGLDVTMKTADNDAALTEEILSVIPQKPTFLFIQFDDIDGAGHRYGYGTPEQLAAITQEDALVGKVYDAYREAGLLSETLFLVTADHGGFRKGHGGYTDTEKYVFFGASGDRVPKGRVGYMQTRDIAAIVLYALGFLVPEYCERGFSAQVPDGIFAEVQNTYRRVVPKPSLVSSKPTPDAAGGEGLFSFFDKEHVKLALFFDHCLRDESDNCLLNEHGCIKFYNAGVRGAYGEFGVTGYATAEGMQIGSGSFTVAAWLKIDRSLVESVPVFGNKNWWYQNRNERGFVLALGTDNTVFHLAWGKDHEDYVIPFPGEISEGWIHTAVAVDKEKAELRFYTNFSLVSTVALSKEYLVSADSPDYPYTIGNDGPGKFNNETWNYLFCMDDLLVFDGAFTQEEIEKLAAYYG